MNCVKAVVFDVFGTLAEIRQKRHPYGKLMRVLRRSGHQSTTDDTARIMTSDVDLAGAAKMFGIEVDDSILRELEQELAAEIATIALYDDAIPTLLALKAAGYKLGLCSNLASPYAAPVRSLLPFDLDAYAWSFQTGSLKPDPAIYTAICDQLGCNPNEVLMVGDTLAADYAGPNNFGMHGYHLKRHGPFAVEKSLRSLSELVPLLCRQPLYATMTTNAQKLKGLVAPPATSVSIEEMNKTIEASATEHFRSSQDTIFDDPEKGSFT